MNYKRLFSYLFFWRVGLLISVTILSRYFALQNNFLGGGINNYNNFPLLWSWANFDGEHYIAIAREGYRPLTHFFFPIYPILINFISEFFGGGFESYLYSGLFISHISLFVGMTGLYKLVKLDYKENITKWTIILLLSFPTSFYFGSVYTESFFLTLSVWSVYFFRKEKYLLSGILAGISTATRIFGLALIPYFLVEILLSYRKSGRFNLNQVLTIFLSLTGIVGYMAYLYNKTGDMLAFFNNISIFGEQRSTDLILFPQVFYRYFFKIIPSLNYEYFPIVFTTFLELFSAIIFLALIGLLFYKKLWGYAFFSLTIFTLVSFSGSFSSFPRYALNMFPAFIVAALYFKNQTKFTQTLFLTLMILCLMVATTLFVRGYWIS